MYLFIFKLITIGINILLIKIYILLFNISILKCRLIKKDLFAVFNIHIKYMFDFTSFF